MEWLLQLKENILIPKEPICLEILPSENYRYIYKNDNEVKHVDRGELIELHSEKI